MSKAGRKPPPPPARRAFAKRLKAQRIAAGYETAKEFAESIIVEHGTYTRWERAETEPDLTTLLRLCSVLHLTPNDLLLTPAKKRRRERDPLPETKTRLAS